jgi:eukaryotic-like serine/threonine-protein kinase
LAARKSHYGEVHRQVEVVLAALAEILQRQGKLGEAEAAWREELAMERKLSGDQHLFVAHSLTALGHVLEAQGKHAEAEVAYRETLGLRRNLPADASELAALLAQLTIALLAQEKFAAAEASARECLALREANFPDHWLTFHAKSLLGDCLLGQKHYVAAEPLLLAGYGGMRQREGSMTAKDKVRLQESTGRLVRLYQATGPVEKIGEWKARLVEFSRTQSQPQLAVPPP